MDIELAVHVLQAKDRVKIGRKHLDLAVGIYAENPVAWLVRRTAHVHEILPQKNPAVRRATNNRWSANGRGLRHYFRAPTRSDCNHRPIGGAGDRPKHT